VTRFDAPGGDARLSPPEPRRQGRPAQRVQFGAHRASDFTHVTAHVIRVHNTLPCIARDLDHVVPSKGVEFVFVNCQNRSQDLPRMLAKQGYWALEFPAGTGTLTGWCTMSTSPSPGWFTVVAFPQIALILPNRMLN